VAITPTNLNILNSLYGRKNVRLGVNGNLDCRPSGCNLRDRAWYTCVCDHGL